MELHLGPTQIIQNNLPILKSSVTPAKSWNVLVVCLFAIQGNIHRGRGLGHGHFWGAITQPTTDTCQEGVLLLSRKALHGPQPFFLYSVLPISRHDIEREA